MKRLIIIVFCLISFLSVAMAQADRNASADNILGTYEVFHNGESTKVSVTKAPDGTYTAQVVWVENRLDEDGNVRLDEKNPDKALRNVECDKVILMQGLVYNKERQKWGDTKVYDPTRGFKANVQCEFMESGMLRVRGSLLGLSQSIYWKKIQ